jgi:hypothetical protein
MRGIEHVYGHTNFAGLQTTKQHDEVAPMMNAELQYVPCNPELGLHLKKMRRQPCGDIAEPPFDFPMTLEIVPGITSGPRFLCRLAGV